MAEPSTSDKRRFYRRRKPKVVAPTEVASSGATNNGISEGLVPNNNPNPDAITKKRSRNRPRKQNAPTGENGNIPQNVEQNSSDQPLQAAKPKPRRPRKSRVNPNTINPNGENTCSIQSTSNPRPNGVARTNHLSQSIHSGLNVDAPAFVPSAPTNNRRPNFKNSSLRRLLQLEKKPVDESDLNLRERLINQLQDNKYECLICCQLITPRQGIWSCKKCYHMFHISGNCIVDWAKKSREDDNHWRCPTCQDKNDKIPYNYFCFCGKDRNPITQKGETPHSCGRPCGGKRGPGCPHPCSEPCHPGPCVECPVMLTKRCSCGSSVKAVRCGSSVKVSCDQMCNKFLNCGRHKCPEICHDGPCSSCTETATEECYCGCSKREVNCFDFTRDGGKFSCGKQCIGTFACGVHQCTMKCHARDEHCGPCPTDPSVVNRCPCGRSTLAQLGIVRTSCSDAVPTCEAVCDKVLLCGSKDRPHRCKLKCHTGPCDPCKMNTYIVCRCSQMKKTVPCTEYMDILNAGGVFRCQKTCRKKKSCGVHKCQEVCCIQEEHMCLQPCNKRLTCGLHNCEHICHAGQCPRCLNASFEEQFCHCGRTMRSPPIPCGAPLPECDEPCARPHSCGHPVMHKCHAEQFCPPCTYLVERECYGKHEIRKNIPCHLAGVSCGRICSLPIPCGVHSCNRNCHSGECVKENAVCTRPCPVLRKPCEHPCNLPCHSTTPCPSTKCNSLVEVLCDCGRRKTSMKCHEVEKEMSRLRALAALELEGVEASNEIPNPGVLKKSGSMEKLNCLPCNDECKRVARNKKLADALSIVTNDDGDPEDPTVTFTETLKAEFKRSKEFVLEVEAVFHALLDQLSDATYTSNAVSHHFRPMSMEKRRVVHEYAAFHGMTTVSVDDAPNRSVIVTAKRGVSRRPFVQLSDLAKYPSVLKAPGPTMLRSNINEEIKKAAAKSAAEALEENMKTMKLERKVYKRVPPTVTKALPIKQHNPFGVLRSDDEDEGEDEQVAPNGPTVVLMESPDNANWWVDETEKKVPTSQSLPTVMGPPLELEASEDTTIRQSWSQEDLSSF